MSKMSGKGKNRIEVLETIMFTLKSDEIYDVLKYQEMSEQKIKQFMYQPLVRDLSKLFHSRGISKSDILAKHVVLWEGNKKTVVNNVVLFGVQHRPDFVVRLKDFTVAVEVKRGSNGQSIREGIGQSIVYSMRYDYVVYLFIDCTPDKKLKESLNEVDETWLLDELWKNHNVMFDIV